MGASSGVGVQPHFIDQTENLQKSKDTKIFNETIANQQIKYLEIMLKKCLERHRM